MTTEASARASFMHWCDQVRGLEMETSYFTFKLDRQLLDQHLQRLKIARAAKQAAYEEYMAFKGRTPRRPVRL